MYGGALSQTATPYSFNASLLPLVVPATARTLQTPSSYKSVPLLSGLFDDSNESTPYIRSAEGGLGEGASLREREEGLQLWKGGERTGEEKGRAVLGGRREKRGGGGGAGEAEEGGHGLRVWGVQLEASQDSISSDDFAPHLSTGQNHTHFSTVSSHPHFSTGQSHPRFSTGQHYSALPLTALRSQQALLLAAGSSRSVNSAP